MPFTLSECPRLSDYILRYQVDGIMWLAKKLLCGVENPLVFNDNVKQVAHTIARIPSSMQVIKDGYIQKIAKEHNLNKRTLEKLVSEQSEIEGKKNKLNRTIRKNTPLTLNGDPKTFPFFSEIIDVKQGTLKSIKIDKVKFVQLLGSFGFTRYASESDTKDGYTFVRLQDNVITEVSAEEIKDFMEDFIRKQYDFEGANIEHVDADALINVFYDSLGKYFSKDLFARVRNESPIIINRDTSSECFLYFQNGFVRVTAEGYELLPYDKMEGSVWGKQMLGRSFSKLDLNIAEKEVDGQMVPDMDNTFSTELPLGDFADFVWRICGQKQQRFISLCSIIGYLVHDFYNYKLKAILFTDSSISDLSEGRTGKTLLAKMLGLIRSYTEINGKDFDASNKNKYEDVNRSTQIVHLNDVRNKGRQKFEFEDVFNDITEGFMVNAKFKTPFRHISKFIISTNRTLPIEGDSQRDRVVEFEMSNFFSSNRSPHQYYKRWFGQDWDELEFSRFDNFICFCVQVFLTEGLITPDTINLEARKLRDGTSKEFLEFMGDIKESITRDGSPWNGYQGSATPDFTVQTDIIGYEFDKRQLFDRFLMQYPDFKASHFTQRRFSDWLKLYAKLHLNAEPVERRSNGNTFIQFKTL